MRKRILNLLFVLTLLLSMSVSVLAADVGIADDEKSAVPYSENTVTFRVIGGTYPTEGCSIGFASWFNDQIADISGYGDYQGAEYQNWIMPEEYTFTEGMTALDVIKMGMAAHGYEEGEDYGISDAFGTYVRAPECLGGEILKRDPMQVGDLPGDAIGFISSWFVTIQRGDEFIEATTTDYFTYSLPLDVEVQAGDIVILHFSYDPEFELKSGVGATYNNGIYSDYVQQYLKVLNVSAEQRAAAYQFEETLLNLGTINRAMGDKIEALEDEYASYTVEQKTLVKSHHLLVAAREIYNVLMKSNVLVAPSLDVELATTVADKNSMTASVTLAKPAVSEEDKNATVMYSYSADGITWSKWQSKNKIDGLPVGTKCYFMAKYMADDTAKWSDSGNSAVISLYTPYVITNRDEWLKAVNAAPRDGTKIILQIAADVNVSQVGSFTQKIPNGANIVMVGDGGRLISPACGQLTNGIGIGTNSTLTLKDLTYISSYDNKKNTNFGHMIWFNGDYGTVNIENSVIYGDSQQTGRIVYSSSNYGVLNIYSGVIDNIADGTVIYADRGADLTVNLKPIGDICIDGQIYAVDETLYDGGINSSGHIEMNLIHQNEYDVLSGSSLIGTRGAYASYTPAKEFTVYDDDALEEMNASTKNKPFVMSEYVGRYGAVIINVTSGASAVPENLTAPDITLEDLVIEYGQVTIPEGIVSSQQEGALFQYRVLKKGTSYDGSESWSVITAYKKWHCEPMEFVEMLEEDQDYKLEVRFNAFGGNYWNSDSVYITFRTGYHTTQLTQPYLSNAAERTRESVTLTTPAGSTQDTTAVLEYRVSVDGQNWSEWQESLEFDRLEPGTKYYFQARYKAGHYLWTDSEGSEIVEISTRAPELEAPELSDEAEVTNNSIKLTAPEASSEDPNAKVQYRISDDGDNWYADWQDSPLFEGLDGSTVYYFQARYVASTQKYLNSEESGIVGIMTKRDPSSAAIVVSETRGYAGKMVEVAVVLQNNPGIVTATLVLDYNSDVLELVGASNGDLFNDSSFSFSADTLYWSDASSDINEDGVLAKLTFKVKENAESGEGYVSVSYNASDIYNVEFDNVEFDVVDGMVTIGSELLGDVNCDGAVNAVDVTVLQRYLAGWAKYCENTLDLGVADLDGDGKVTPKDATWLTRAVAGWDGYTLAAE